MARLALAALSVAALACQRDRSPAEPPRAPGPPAGAPLADTAAAPLADTATAPLADTAAAPLATVVIGPPPSEAAVTVVLLHGFGAAGDDLVGLAHRLDVARTVSFVFPAAPLALSPTGDARAWWMIEGLRRVTDGEPPDRSDQIPAGLASARAAVTRLLDHLEAQGARRIVLGGFSQGAMLSLDVALHRDRPLAGLALFSGTRINRAAWTPLLPRLRGTPIVLSHGTTDPILPFSVARSLADDLLAAGARVDWLSFPGGHTIPPSATARLSNLLADLTTP